ncbi:polysaccharide chain length determinant protein [Geomonas silvestris]|uniref:Polysaccharide chain length determinant protein n=1 Tax=Geomonas silvestris TaxID=2740184 RepID=A0A6V8MIP8_9BACT|nr:Wzz/FepE/Etk N-terminal domain-containing protein [Geomonas silvestris]GFO59673.1 polysaccharide chain length determinant protein [Geomonas silvestris]
MPAERLEHAEDEINLLDYLIVLLKWKRLILGVTFSCLAFAALLGLTLPKSYRAETRILPPQQGSAGMASQLLSQVGSSLTGLSGVLSGNSQTDLYLGMLQSRSVLDNIIKRFDLKKRYHEETFEAARKKLTKNLRVQADAKSNVIVIAVEDREAQQAADLANAFVTELRWLTKGLAVTEAAQRRLFFEDQLKGSRESLTKAEEGVRGFQERTGTLQVDEQVKAVIKNIAQLRAEIASKEVELRVVKTYAKPSNPDLQKAEETLDGMKAQLAKLESKTGSGSDPLMPAGRMPSVGTEYLRKLRDLKFNEALFEMLLKQYEVARLDEAREAAVIQVIDPAVVPEKSVKPKMASLLAVFGCASLLFSILLAFFLEKRETMFRQPGNRQRLEKLKQYASLGG